MAARYGAMEGAVMEHRRVRSAGKYARRRKGFLSMMHHRSGLRIQRIALAIVMILVTLVVQGAQLTPASAASAPASHGPAPGSGTKTTPPFVRVLDGKSFEAFLDNVLVGVVIVGIDVAPGNSACGMEATRQLTALAQGGLILEEDSTIAYDSSYHRLYSARTHVGRVVAEELVKAGVAKVNGVGEPRHQYAAVEADARAGTTGPVGQTLAYDWEFDDGTPGTTEANPTHQYTRPGVYDPVLFVYDSSGNTPPTSVIEIRVGTPPTPRITAPSPSLTYAIDDTINFSGSATFTDAAPPPRSPPALPVRPSRPYRYRAHR